MGRTYPSSLCLKKHVRIFMWGAPMFLFFWMGEPIGWYKHAPKWCFLSFWKGWGFDFPSSSQKVPIKFVLFPSISHRNSFVLIKFPKIPIKFLLFPSITHQNLSVPIKFLPFPSITHQYPFVLIKFPSNSSCSHQGSIKFLLFPSTSSYSYQ